MGFKRNESQQITIYGRLFNLTDREMRLFKDSWAKPFGDRIFPMIDEPKFEALYCGDNGNIITCYDYDVNLHPDVKFAAEIIVGLGPQEEKTVVVTDGAYASEDNFQAAAGNNIELVPTTLTRIVAIAL
jgi:hypothetical protein